MLKFRKCACEHSNENGLEFKTYQRSNYEVLGYPVINLTSENAM